MLRLLLVTALIALIAPATVQAARVPLPPALTVHAGVACPAYEDGGSCSSPTGSDVYIAPGADRFDRFHEIAHQFDRQLLNGSDRAWFTRLFGFPAETRWLGDEAFYTADVLSQAVPGEVFADAYAACALGLRPQGARAASGLRVSDWRTAYGYHPSSSKHRRACNAISVLGLVRPAYR